MPVEILLNKYIDGEPHTECLQLLQPFEVGVSVVHNRAFSQLDHEIRGFQPGACQGMSDVLQQLAML